MPWSDAFGDQYDRPLTHRHTCYCETGPGAPRDLPVPERGMRANGVLPADDPVLHICALTHVPDMTLSTRVAANGTVAPPSARCSWHLDHAMVPPAVPPDEWLLYAQDTPSARRSGPGPWPGVQPRRPPGRLGGPGKSSDPCVPHPEGDR